MQLSLTHRTKALLYLSFNKNVTFYKTVVSFFSSVIEHGIEYRCFFKGIVSKLEVPLS